MKLFGKKEIVIAVVMMVMLGACNSKTTEEETSTSNVQNPTVKSTENISVDANASTSRNDANMSATLKSLTLSINKATLNKDENTTVKVVATYSDKTTKDVTSKVEWITTPSDSTKVKKTTLTALKDKNTSIQAKLNNILSNKIALNITWVVNGHVLPPEPDKTVNDSTLLGIDVNDNGVRDDVERWIYEEYKDKHPIYVDIAMQAARGYKLVLETPDRAKEIYPEVEKSIYCEGYYKYEAEFFNEKNLIEKNIDDRDFRHKIYFNTKERMDTYRQYDTLLSGDSYTLPDGKEMKAMCDFNTSKY